MRASTPLIATAGDTKMHNLILQPAAGAKTVAHLQRTILNTVTVDEVRSLLRDEELRKVEAAAMDGRFHVWGAPDREGAKGSWERFAVGDFVLFYASLRFRRIAPRVARSPRPRTPGG